MRSAITDAADRKFAQEIGLVAGALGGANVYVTLGTLNFRAPRTATYRIGHFVNFSHDSSATGAAVYRNLVLDGMQVYGFLSVNWSAAAYAQAISSGERLVPLGAGTHQLVLQAATNVAGVWTLSEGMIYVQEGG